MATAVDLIGKKINFITEGLDRVTKLWGIFVVGLLYKFIPFFKTYLLFDFLNTLHKLRKFLNTGKRKQNTVTKVEPKLISKIMAR